MLNTIINIDSSQSGTQICSGLLKDTQTARMTNMTGLKDKQDLYQTVGDKIKSKLDWTHGHFKKSDSPDLYDYITKHSKEHDLFTRSSFKKPCMTITYGSTPLTMSEQMEETWKDITGEKLSRRGSLKLGHIIYNTLEEVLPAPISLMKSFTGIGELISKQTGEPLKVTTRGGSKIQIMKTKELDTFIGRTNSLGQTRLKMQTEEIDPKSIGKSFAANMIQSFDSMIMTRTLTLSEESGIPVLPIFDSFGTTPDRLDELQDCVRQSYIDILGGEQLKDIYDNIKDEYPGIDIPSELILETGSYNITRELGNSKYFCYL